MQENLRAQSRLRCGSAWMQARFGQKPSNGIMTLDAHYSQGLRNLDLVLVPVLLYLHTRYG